MTNLTKRTIFIIVAYSFCTIFLTVTDISLTIAFVKNFNAYTTAEQIMNTIFVSVMWLAIPCCIFVFVGLLVDIRKEKLKNGKANQGR